MGDAFGEIGGMLIFLALVGVSLPLFERIERFVIDMVDRSDWDGRGLR